ncbi:lyase family protein [Peristeroidobacter soli]|uniref:lyase family protein n=1 Tax=Peristeroidobacter soli TaxID=2497877 RepID=UPI00158C3B4E|nr:lyase family protein [Peristeroidobacter soli]
MRTATCLLMLLGLAPRLQAREARDPFEWLDRMNRASAVMLLEEDIIEPKQAATIAAAIEKLHAESREPNFRRSGLYVSIEPRLLEIGGPDVSRLHTGRSTIDTGRTNLRLQQRDLILNSYQELLEARATLLRFDEAHAQAIVPAYTLGVQAQPTSLGHYIAGYLSVFERHATLLADTYLNINQSPLGAAALGTSSYLINRQRLADLLGFEAPIRNSFDAVQLATLEASMRITGATSAMAMTTSELMSDLEDQYRMTHPWLTLPRELTVGSSIMPQKLNPTMINETRAQASTVLGRSVSYMFGAHKASAGDTDLMFSGPNEALTDTAAMMRSVARIFSVLQFDEPRALDEVLSDYAVATELANALQRLADVPFRDAHHVAAAVVQFGRDRKLRPTEIAFGDFKRIYADAAAKYHLPRLRAAFNEAEFKRVLRPENMVMSSRGYGGPQPAEVAAMLRELALQLETDRGWLREKNEQLAAADARLDAAFSKL